MVEVVGLYASGSHVLREFAGFFGSRKTPTARRVSRSVD